MKVHLRKPERGRPTNNVEAYNSETCDTAGSIGNWISIVGLGLLGAGLIIGTGGIAGGIILGYGMAGTIAGGGLAIGLEIGC